MPPRYIVREPVGCFGSEILREAKTGVDGVSSYITSYVFYSCIRIRKDLWSNWIEQTGIITQPGYELM